MRFRIATLAASLALFAFAFAAPTAATLAGPQCTIVGTGGADVLNGTAGDDVICAMGGGDQVNGRGGNDTILLGRGTDFFRGGRGNDVIRGGPGPDFGDGGVDDDRIFLQGGDDLIVSEDRGADLLSGGSGDDNCLSTADGVGDDRVVGGTGEDTFNADDGDTVSGVENGPTPCEGG